HLQLWAQYLNATDFKGESIEDLFRIANPLVLGAAANQLDDYDVCSLLPTSEKQISLEYASISEKLTQRQEAPPAVVNITILDRVPTYSASNDYNGLAFYCSDPDLPAFFNKIDQYSLTAEKNIGRYATLVPLEILGDSPACTRRPYNFSQ